MQIHSYQVNALAGGKLEGVACILIGALQQHSSAPAENPECSFAFVGMRTLRCRGLLRQQMGAGHEQRTEEATGEPGKKPPASEHAEIPCDPLM